MTRDALLQERLARAEEELLALEDMHKQHRADIERLYSILLLRALGKIADLKYQLGRMTDGN